ncbi:MAG: hypothetical protein QOE70_5025 [Chthoniobacter sp.]|jgi:hypothetical protein|nr:hypothetical protein [Chthoniobacter sp.]
MRKPSSLLCAALITYALGCSEPGFAASRAELLATAIRIDRVQFRDATVQQAVDYLQRRAQEQLNAGQKLHIYCAGAGFSPMRVTFQFFDQPLYDSLREIARQTGLPLKTADNAFSFELAGKTIPVARNRRLLEEDNIRATVFRYLFGYNDSNPDTDVSAYFINIDGNDPSEAFMARFANHRLPVKKASAAITGKGLNTMDRVTGKLGLPFSVTDLKWLSESKVEISGNYHEGGDRYEVTHTTNGWWVTKETNVWVQ